jgi:hypothetical protein
MRPAGDHRPQLAPNLKFVFFLFIFIALLARQFYNRADPTAL